MCISGVILDRSSDISSSFHHLQYCKTYSPPFEVLKWCSFVFYCFFKNIIWIQQIAAAA